MVWAMRRVAGVLVVLVLAGCGGGGSAAPSSSTSTSSSSSTTTKVVYGAGDVAACKGYARAIDGADADITSITTEATPIFLTIDVFERLGDKVEAGTVAATDPQLVAAFAGTVAAVRSAQATAEAWRDGELDLSADLEAIHEASTAPASLCIAADPAGSYGVFGTGS